MLRKSTSDPTNYIFRSDHNSNCLHRFRHLRKNMNTSALCFLIKISRLETIIVIVFTDFKARGYAKKMRNSAPDRVLLLSGHGLEQHPQR